LVVGGGGREHAICWALSRDPGVDALYAAPGNAGIARVATTVPLAVDDLAGLAEFAGGQSIDLTVVGPEGPLVAGLVDVLDERGLRAFGPNKDGARIEGSKAWARELCERHGIPSPAYRRFDSAQDAFDYLDGTEPPVVVKADGLAAGKGVTVAEDRSTARRAVEDCLVGGAFGGAGRTVVVEECLVGREVSALALVDGLTVLPLALAQDHKRIFDGDRGPNTGGMGAFSPSPFVDAEIEAEIDGLLRRSAEALHAEGVRYRGILYAGLMITADGPKVLEFNCRFGDPETQVILPRLRTGLGGLLLACAEGRLSAQVLEWTPEACVGVVAASDGYPGAVEAGKEIHGLDEIDKIDGVVAFHSGTAERDGRVVTAGGRVLTVTALGASHDEARARAYEALSHVSFDGMQHRSDIARDLPQRVAP
jgi:phosphoribosylamine---glycine ligase